MTIILRVCVYVYQIAKIHAHFFKKNSILIYTENLFIP